MLDYASAGTGTLAHSAGELFKHQAKVDITHIPYRGTAQSTLDLIQGRLDLSVSTIRADAAVRSRGQAASASPS